MIDLRYHIYSLAAVFFALAIGIVIGTSFAKRSPMTISENRTIQRYENSMRVLKREIEKSVDECVVKDQVAKNSEEFCRTILPIIAKDKLAWRNVAIVQTGDYDDLTGSIKSVLELAGAKVTSVTDMSRTFDFNDENKVSHVLKSCGIAPPSDSKEARDKLFSLFSETLAASKYTGLLSTLEEAQVAGFTGDYDRFNKLVVLVGGSKLEKTNSAASVDAQLVSQLQKCGITVVGCESKSAGSSYIPFWSKSGIATVDNADSPIGQTALLCALNGEKAKFGIKETADRMIPQSLETN